MPGVKAKPTLRKIAKLHKKFGGSDREVKFVKFTRTGTEFKSTITHSEYTSLKYPAIIKSIADPELAAAIGGALDKDQRIFIFAAHSFVDRDPDTTLADRAEKFLRQISEIESGGILYGSDLYSIITFFIKLGPIATVPLQYAVLATSVKKSNV